MDLDNEELEATRKLNGVDKEEIEKAILRDAKKNLLDKNDTEAAKIIIEKCLLGNWVIVGERINYIKLALKTLLVEREADKKRIKELEEENLRLKGRIDVTNWQEKTVYESLKEKYIPVQKVKDVLQKNRNELFSITYVDPIQYEPFEMQIERINKIEKELLEDK